MKRGAHRGQAVDVGPETDGVAGAGAHVRGEIISDETRRVALVF